MARLAGKRLLFARLMSVLLLPAGLVCVAVPFWLFTLPGRGEILDDTRAAFGAGRDAAPLRATYVDCVAIRSGSNSSRGIGMTDYDCVIDLSGAPRPVPVAPTPARESAPAPVNPDPLPPYDPSRSYEDNMAEYNRRAAEVARKNAEQSRAYQAGLDAFIAENRARSGTSNRLERTLATDRSGDLPTLRLLSAPDEPRRIGLIWGAGELGWRWAQWLVISLIFFGFGGACLFVVRMAWRRGGG